jgi:predicted ester cyclase
VARGNKSALPICLCSPINLQPGALPMNPHRHILAAALAAAATSFAPLTQAQQPADATSTARALVARYAAFKSARDATRLSEIYPENYIENSGRNASGLAALTENWRGQFAAIPDLQITVHDVIASGDKVVARITYSGTHTTPFFAGIAPTGRKFTLGTIDIWRVEAGKFAEHWDQVDFAGLQRQLSAKAGTP